MEASMQSAFDGSQLPANGVKTAAGRLAALKGSDGVRNVTTDYKLVDVMRRIGDDEVREAIRLCLDWGFSQSTFSWEQFCERVDRFRKVNTSRNMIGQSDYERAKRLVRKMLERGVEGHLKFQPVTDENDLLSRLPKVKASAGFLGCCTGKSKKGENLREIMQGYDYKMANLESSDYSPAVFGCRTAGTGITDDDGKASQNWKCKSKVVQIISGEDITLEMTTAQPFYGAFCKVPQYAGGMNPSDMTTRFNQLRSNFHYWVSVDYSSYDSTIPDWLIRDAFGLIFDLFEDIPDGYREFIIRGFTYTRMVWENGEIIRKTHGVPSGSYFTQAIDSVCNLIMVATFMIHQGIDDWDCLVMGDDNSIWTNNPVKLERFSYYIWTRFGVKVSSEKCSAGCRYDDPEFLSRVWTTTGAKRNIIEVVWKAITPERWRKYPKGVRPELLIYVLLDVYPITIRQHFDMQAVREAVPNLVKLFYSIDLSLVDLPGSVRFKREYLDGDFTMRVKPAHRLGLTVERPTHVNTEGRKIVIKSA